MRIAIGSDHGGFALKETLKAHLQEQGHEAVDFGAHSTASCDYPDYAEKVAEAVLSGGGEFGILVCGTGVGVSMAANKFPGIRAALVSDAFTAEYTRRHNNANILCMGERTIGPGLACLLCDIFLKTSFEGGRHQRRVDKITAIEQKYARYPGK